MALLFIGRTRTTQITLTFCSCFLISEVIRRLIAKYRKGRKKNKTGFLKEICTLEESLDERSGLLARKPSNLWNTAIFFPDPTIAPSFAKGSIQTTIAMSPCVQLLHYFEDTKTSIRMCILLASYRPFRDVILKKRREGLSIQIITDYDTLSQHNYNCQDFIKYGIPVRAKNTGNLMHNKFVIFDDEAVLTGSLNFTTQAITKNSENVVVITDRGIVDSYLKEFKNIWKKCYDVDRSFLH